MGFLRNFFLGRDDGMRARVRRFVTGSILGLSTNPSDAASAADGASEAVAAPPPSGLETAGFVFAAPEDAVPDGEVIEVMLGDTPIALCRVGGKVHALGNVCPHAGGPIGDGDLMDNEVICPWHGWGFDVESGVCSVDPELALEVHEVRVESNRVWVRVAEDAADR